MNDSTLRQGLRFLLDGTGYDVSMGPRGHGNIVNLKRSQPHARVQQVWVYQTDEEFPDPLQQGVVLVPLNSAGEQVGDHSEVPVSGVRQAILLATL
jgi:hypothetical protein